jgi:hypothetical protein
MSLKTILADYAHCKHCGRVIAWDDWSYTHLDGWANCRKADKSDELDEAKHCEVLASHPINPQPASRDEAFQIPIIAFVVGEDGARHPWRKGDPIPILTITGR